MPEIKAKRDRSPSFPFISLKDSVNRLEAFDRTFGRHPAPASKSGLAWGMKEESSQAFQTLAALKAFGLIKYEGSASDRLALLTDDAKTYLRAQQDIIKSEIVRRLATKPALLQQFWSVWGADRPPDPVCLDTLVLKHSFTDSAAHNFLRVYDETIAFAGLSNDDTVDETDGDTFDPEFSVGDAVNWEINGQIQWRQPRKIVAVDQHDDGSLFYKVRGGRAEEEGWIPVEQAIAQVQKPSDGLKAFPPPRMIEAADDESDFNILTASERILAKGLLSKEANFKLIVSGVIGPKEIDRLISKLQLDRDILAASDESE